jgi:hypothetical protein
MLFIGLSGYKAYRMLSTYSFPVFFRIMYGELHPQWPQNINGKKYTILLQDMIPCALCYKGNYQLAYLRPIDLKTAFYEQLLLAETDRYCAGVCEEISYYHDDRILAYLRDQILDKHLATSLQRVGELIIARRYQLQELENPSMLADRERLSSIYIFHLLKCCLARAYLEVQDVLAGEVKRTLSEADLYLQYAGELPPVCTFISRATPEVLNNEVKGGDELNGFTYKFIAEYPEDLRDLHDGMIKASLIAQDTPFARFKVLFSGKPVTQPVVWTGNISELFYFVKLLHNDYEAVEYARQRQWEIACRCFIRPDGACFERDKIRGQKKPTKTYLIIERLVQLLEY